MYSVRQISISKTLRCFSVDFIVVSFISQPAIKWKESLRSSHRWTLYSSKVNLSNLLFIVLNLNLKTKRLFDVFGILFTYWIEENFESRGKCLWRLIQENPSSINSAIFFVSNRIFLFHWKNFRIFKNGDRTYSEQVLKIKFIFIIFKFFRSAWWNFVNFRWWNRRQSVEKNILFRRTSTVEIYPSRHAVVHRRLFIIQFEC